MNEHDPMCPKRGLHPADEAMMAVVVQCRCEEYARVRADERERIVAELEGPVRESEAMYAHAEAVAAKLVEVIRVDDLRLRTQKGHTAQARRERDAARAEVAALKQAWDTGIKAVEYRVLDGLRAKVDVLEHDATCSFIPQDGPCDCVRGAVLALIDEAQPKQRTLRVELEDEDANISE